MPLGRVLGDRDKTRSIFGASGVLIAIVALSALAPGSAGAREGGHPTASPASEKGDLRTPAIRAQITYQTLSSGRPGDVHLNIFRDGQLILHLQPRPQCQACLVEPNLVERGKPVHIVQLDRTAEPEVVFDLYAGGAHCCFYAMVFRWRPGLGRYRGSRHEFFNQLDRLGDPDRDGRTEFISRDDRFSYVFSSFGGSRWPPQVFRFRAGGFQDVTRSFPRLIKSDRRREWRSYRSGAGRRDIKAPLAALVSEDCLLHRCMSGFRLLRHALHRGFLDYQGDGQWKPYGHRYIEKLRRFLKRTGYTS